jgi:pyrroloquinoline quinone biosynthesis protein B
MIIKVLGSAAGGGFPQANCNCRNCADARAGKPGLRRRTQSSLAVSPDGLRWVLLNASPDLRQQIDAKPQLAPHSGQGPRSSPIGAVVLTNGDIDHVAGLLSLREGFSFGLYAYERALAVLAANPIFNVLDRSRVPHLTLPLNESIEVMQGLQVEAFAVPGKVALYMEDETAGPTFGTQAGDTLGLKVSDASGGHSFFYIPGCAAVDAALAEHLGDAALVLFDGTLYTDDELITQGLSAKTGRRMGHIAMAGPDGSMAAFQALNVTRRIYVHMNNSNPVLREDSPERAAVERAGWEIAHDGLEIHL